MSKARISRQFSASPRRSLHCPVSALLPLLWVALLGIGTVSITAAQTNAVPNADGTRWTGYGMPGNLPAGMGGGGFADLVSSPESETDLPSVLLLKTGMVVRGEIFPTEKGYDVKTDFGSMAIPKANVEKVGRDISEIYRYKRSVIAPENWQDMMNLAEWAVTNGLSEQGYADYEQARQAAPDARIVGLIDFRIKSLGPKPGAAAKEGIAGQAASNTPSITSPTANPLPSPESLNAKNAAFDSKHQNYSVNGNPVVSPVQAGDVNLAGIPTFGIGVHDTGAVDPDIAPAQVALEEMERKAWEEELGTWSAKLPRSVVEGFSKKVQPVLLGRCASADCHGSNTESRFRLTTPRRFGSSATMRNLRETMRYIDPNNPTESPLLVYAARSHGGGKAAFPRKNHFQYEAVQTWLFHVAGSSAVRRQNLLASQPYGIPMVNETGPIRQAARIGEFSDQNLGLPLVPEQDEQGFDGGFDMEAVLLTPPAASPLPGDSTETSPHARNTGTGTPGTGTPGTVAAKTGLRGVANQPSWIVDPLDPEVFNRKYHPRLTRTALRTDVEPVLR